jgi:hypothetical protein
MLRDLKLEIHVQASANTRLHFDSLSKQRLLSLKNIKHVKLGLLQLCPKYPFTLFHVYRKASCTLVEEQRESSASFLFCIQNGATLGVVLNETLNIFFFQKFLQVKPNASCTRLFNFFLYIGVVFPLE